MTDTIFALSSGAPPAAIAVIRISGPEAGPALQAMARRIPEPRRAVLRTLRDARDEPLDEAMVLWLPGPANSTGEDCAELHCHGGRAVIAAVLATLAEMPGLRAAEPGEFTRRAFANGRIDLAQAEALVDLLTAETELQRRVAQAGIGGVLSAQVLEWRDRVLTLSATVEAVLDFSDEDDVTNLPPNFRQNLDNLSNELDAALARPPAERLRDGVRVVIAGPPNTGKSSLFNTLLGDEAAIVSSTAGTTRDIIERPVVLSGLPVVLIDTAGLRNDGVDPIEAIGIARAEAQLARADIVLWLGPEGVGPSGCVEVDARCDLPERLAKGPDSFRLSSLTGEGLEALEAELGRRGRALLPKAGDAAVNARQAMLIQEAREGLQNCPTDPLLAGEALRVARGAFDRLLGLSGVEDMLDHLFGRFCIGK